MMIERALTLKVGDKVRCPADRGNNPFIGVITHTCGSVCENFQGVKYLWLEVKGPTHTKSVWPSNRLSAVNWE